MEKISEVGETWRLYREVIVYGGISLGLVTFLLMTVYVWVRKSRLNWFESTTLENAKTLGTSNEALVDVRADAGSVRTQSNDSERSARPAPSSEDDYAISKDGSLPTTPTSETSWSDAGGALVGGGGAGGRRVLLPSAWPRLASMQAKLDPSTIDATLYEQNTNKSDQRDARGVLHLAMHYDASASLLTVRLIEANDIQPREFSGTADPYAKIRLLPDRTNVWQTRIHKKTLNPVFDEDFVFEVEPQHLCKRSLEILLCDFDAYSRHHNIGSIRQPLDQIEFGERVSLWKPLEACGARDASLDLGELMVSLSYLPSAGRLTAVVVKARNLKIVDETRSTSDPFVKVSLLMNEKRLKKRKTTIQRNNLCPVFNEAVVFDITKDNLKKCAIEFCIYHDNLLGAKELMGQVVIGNSKISTHDDKIFFNDVTRNKSATAKWLQLKDRSTKSS